MTLVLAAAALGACSGNPLDSLDSLNPFKTKEDESQRGTLGFVQGFLGGVAADEPRAALVGRDILSSGGSAADAATAMSFALSVTLPSAAGLGGGGICLYHDGRTNATETLDFTSLPATRRRAPGAAPVAVPGLVRGVAVLHARYGRLKWAQVISPAEGLARFGNSVSRALGRDIRMMPPGAQADPGMRRLFVNAKTGQFIGEGAFVKQPDLSAILARLRSQGGGDFYAGLVARQFAAAVAASGGGLTLDDLRAYRPRWRPTLKVPYIKNTTLHFPMTNGPAGALTALIVGMLVESGDWEDASENERAHLFAEVTARAVASQGQWLGPDGTLLVAPERLLAENTLEAMIGGVDRGRRSAPGSGAGTAYGQPGNRSGTAFVVVDRGGSAAACMLTLNGNFGAGRVARGTGIIMGAPPAPPASAAPFLSAAMLVFNLQNTFFYAAAGSGEAWAPSAVAGVTARTLLGRTEETLLGAMAAKRVHNGGTGDATHYEQGLPEGTVDALRRLGHRTVPTAAMGLVNAVFCETGVPTKEMFCLNQTDPRGFGLAAGSE